MFKIKKAGDTSITKVKGLIMGESGAGKSHLIATSPKPLILLCEPNGAASLAASNPDALIIECLTLQQFMQVYVVIEKGVNNNWNDDGSDDERKKLWKQLDGKFETICIDSLSELQSMMKKDIARNNSGDGQPSVFGQRTKGRNGFDDWTVLLERCTECIKKFMKLPFHFICTALVTIKEDSEGITHCYPSFDGSLREKINCMFSGVGYLYQNGKQTEDGYSQRALLLDGHDRIKSKAFPNTHGILVEPNITTLIEAVLQVSIDNEPEPEPEPPKPKRKNTRKKKEPAPTMNDLKELGLVDEDGHIDEPQRLMFGRR